MTLKSKTKISMTPFVITIVGRAVLYIGICVSIGIRLFV